MSRFARRSGLSGNQNMAYGQQHLLSDAVMRWRRAFFVIREVVILVLMFAVLEFLSASTILAAGVVGTGTPSSCTENALNAALLGGGTVQFNCGGSPVTIYLSGPKEVSSNTTINGGGLISLRGTDSQVMIFSVNGGVTLNLDSITISNGQNLAESGGAILNRGFLSVNNSTFTGNAAGGGGAIFNDASGSVVVSNSTFTHNVASKEGGAIKNLGSLTVTQSTFVDNTAVAGAGIFSEIGSTFSVANSTFYGNTAAGSVGGTGGAIYNSGNGDIINVTIAGNSATGTAAGVYNNSGALRLANTIIANNTAGGNCAGSITDNGHNLQFNPNSGCGASIPSGDPKLDPSGLQDNGGSTQTVALQSGSAAIDVGDNVFCNNPLVNSVDQRGIARPQPAGGVCDIGAYEFGLGTPWDAASAPSNLFVKIGLTWQEWQRFRASLTWKDNSIDESDFHAEYSLDSGNTWQTGCTVPANQSSCLISPFPAGQALFRVRAHRHLDNVWSDFSNVVNAKAPIGIFGPIVSTPTVTQTTTRMPSRTVTVATRTPSPAIQPNSPPSATRRQTNTRSAPTATATPRMTRQAPLVIPTNPPPGTPTATRTPTPTRMQLAPLNFPTSVPSPTTTPIPGTHIHQGTGTVLDSYYFNFGTGDIFYSQNQLGIGYLYSLMPPATATFYYADVISPSRCSPAYDGYLGVARIQDFTNAGSHTFETRWAIQIGAQNSPCYTGILLFHQNGMYGGLDPIEIDSAGTLRYNYWYDDSGNSDFSSLPSPIAPSSLFVKIALTWQDWQRYRAQLMWKDNSTDESDFHAEYSLDSGSTWQTGCTVPANQSSCLISPFPAGQALFRVRAHRHSDNVWSDFSNVVDAKAPIGIFGPIVSTPTATQTATRTPSRTVTIATRTPSATPTRTNTRSAPTATATPRMIRQPPLVIPTSPSPGTPTRTRTPTPARTPTPTRTQLAPSGTRGVPGMPSSQHRYRLTNHKWYISPTDLAAIVALTRTLDAPMLTQGASERVPA